ncbi:kinase-like domain-containing protein [Gigaspora rosea]|uniref:Kinase-like domain-containing protein n=1 Tax=Gigaspora rosea TaxID=44941 RepID=A0A397UXK4_9GLOM|nr:kinase-like domain-containing protein [Gigaspora rosea]
MHLERGDCSDPIITKPNLSIKWLQKAIEDDLINFFDYHKFDISEEIGRSTHGIVYKALWKDCQLTVALKSLTGNEDIISQEFIDELRHLQKVSFHPNIIQFYGVIKEPHAEQLISSYKMVLQFAADGDLRNYLRLNFSSLQWTDKLRIAEEITLGLLFLHTNNIVHLDLHSKNILVHEGKMMIADFGRSKNESSIVTSGGHGVPAYIEPQCYINPSYKRNKKSDIYSLGVILWEISSGKPPFESTLQREAVAIQIYKGERETPIENTPEYYVELYQRCWDTDPAKRPETEFIHDALENLISGKNLDLPDLSNVVEIKTDYLRPPNVHRNLVTSDSSLSNNEVEDIYMTF